MTILDCVINFECVSSSTAERPSVLLLHSEKQLQSRTSSLCSARKKKEKKETNQMDLEHERSSVNV